MVLSAFRVCEPYKECPEIKTPMSEFQTEIIKPRCFPGIKCGLVLSLGC